MANYLLIGGLKGIIYICNINTYQKISEIYAHKSYVTSLLILNNGILLSSGGYNEIKEWIIPKMFCISIIENPDISRHLLSLFVTIKHRIVPPCPS